MIEPKFYQYFKIDKNGEYVHGKTKHGYEYVKLVDDAPADIKADYRAMLEIQDDRIKHGKRVLY